MTQIGTVRLETQNSGVVDVPVFEPGDSASGIYEFVRVETASGPGFIPVTDPVDATYPYLRVQSQNNGIVAVTDTPGSDIPDSVLSRPPDDSTDSDDNRKFGVRVDVSQDWPQFQARISANTDGRVTTAYIHDVSDGSLLDSTDISSLVSGEVITFDDAGLTAGNTYNVVADAGGANYDAGFYSQSNFPYASSDGNLEIVNGAIGEQSTNPSAYVFDEVGNINL